MISCIFCQNDETRCESCKLANEKKEQARKKRADKAKIARKEKDAAMRSLGLVKVRGALGGVHWE